MSDATEEKGLLDKSEICRRRTVLLHIIKQITDMLCELKISTEAVGLGIHPGKTKILSNQDKTKVKEITVDNIKIEILEKTASARYLGQKITFVNTRKRKKPKTD